MNSESFKGMQLILIIILGLMNSCSNYQRISNDEYLTGNWQITENTVAENYDYQEIYFDGKQVYFFLSGTYEITFVINYSFKENKLYFLNSQNNSTVRTFTIEKTATGFIIKEKGGQIVYGKLKGDNNLSDLVENKISKKQFELAFMKRMQNF